MHPIPVASLPLKDPVKVQAAVAKMLEEEQLGTGEYSHKRDGWHALGKLKIRIDGHLKAIRSLWAVRDLSEVQLEENNSVKIINPTTVLLGEVTLRTLRGVLIDAVGAEDGNVVYEHIAKVEKECFSWHTRGPRILQKLISFNCDIAIIEEYDVHFGPYATFPNSKTSSSEPGDTAKPSSTFREAMSANGYDGRLYDGYMKQGEGIGIFWKRDTFSAKQSTNSCVSECGDDSVVPITEYCPNLANIGFTVKNASTGELLPERFRRHLALIRLIHISTGKELQVCGVHLSPTSRDDSERTRGEELRQTVEIVSRQTDVPAILTGDFNINLRAKREEHILKSVEAYEASDGRRLFRVPGPESDYILQDLYGDVNDREDVSTSFSRTRNETIDYIFYTPNTLEVTWRGELVCSLESMPNEQEPSDHIALEAEFKFKI